MSPECLLSAGFSFAFPLFSLFSSWSVLLLVVIFQSGHTLAVSIDLLAAQEIALLLDGLSSWFTHNKGAGVEHPKPSQSTLMYKNILLVA